MKPQQLITTSFFQHILHKPKQRYSLVETPRYQNLAH